MTSPESKDDDNSDELDWSDCPLFAPAGAHIPNVSTTTAAGQDDADATSALSALSHLLYDDETPQEASELLRDEGNRHFKRRGKYALHLAVQKYTAAIKAAEGDPPSVAAALNNRAAAELKLGNDGRALADALESLRVCPAPTVKAHFRAAVAATNLHQLDVALRQLDLGLALVPPSRRDGADGKLLRAQREIVLSAQHRNEQRAAREGGRLEVKDEIAAMLKRRGLRMGRPAYAMQREYPVTRPSRLDGSGLDGEAWCWPVLLVYPTDTAGLQSDYMQSVAEDATMADIIDLVFGPRAGERPWWDGAGRYADAGGLEVRVRPGRGGGGENGYGAEEEEDDDEDEEDDGWRIDRDQQGVSVASEVTLGQLVGRTNYVIPLYPVLQIVPKPWRP